jgi:sigma-B regulation protein RsbU (phosphoserine phosphatase)
MFEIMPWPEFKTSKCLGPSGSRLYVYSDGCHEIHTSDGSEWPFDDFVRFMAEPSQSSEPLHHRLLQKARSLTGTDQLDDDFSIIELKF